MKSLPIIGYRKNSRLLILMGVPGQANENAPEEPQGIYYSEWRGNRLRPIRITRTERQ